MRYKNIGFRPFYHNFIAVPLNGRFDKLIEGFPGAKKANGVLTYGYYDREAGLTLAILAAAHIKGKSASFEAPNNTIHSMIRIGAVEEDELLFFADEDGSLKERYSEKLEMLRGYDADKDIEKTREFDFLDDCRHEHFIDDIMVYLTKDGLQPEGCWVRMEGLLEHSFIGILQNEPDQDFGYHLGDKIGFFIHKTEEDKIVCISDMNPSVKLSPKDLEDGSMLEAAISLFNEERTEKNFIEVIELLRDSHLWVPCTAVMSDEDMAEIEKLIEKAGDNLDSLIGTVNKTKGQTRMIPDILQNGEDFFFPGFTTAEAMGDYGNAFSKIQAPMLQVISLARNNDKEVKGIVINAFSNTFILDREIWDLVENAKSRIVE